MVTDKQLAEAIEIIKQYQKQQKTKIIDWIKTADASVRLQKIMCEMSKEVEYVEDVTRVRFMMMRNTGKKTWEEFCELIE